MKTTSLRTFYRFFFFFTFSIFTSCGTYQTVDFDQFTPPKAPDYSKENSWAVLPTTYRQDFKKYASQRLDTLQVDVFYVYPTLNTSKKDTRWNIPINDAQQREKVLGKAVLMQASAFATVGKVYVPYYRQAHIRSFSMTKSGGEKALDLAYEDVKKAFEFYLTNYNKGRPIIMVGHSQGTTHTIRLLSDFFDGKELQKKLVAAYIPGIRVQPSQFSEITQMTQPNQTGGFVSWNTFKKNHYPKKDKNWYNGSVTTNPITWDNKVATNLEDHKGFLYTNHKIYSNALTIQVTDGLIWSSNPKFPLRFFMSFLRNYHAGDINLFWQDIRENVHLRVQTYLEKN